MASVRVDGFNACLVELEQRYLAKLVDTLEFWL